MDKECKEVECRREFLKSAGCFGLALGIVGLSSGAADALPVFFTEGIQGGGETR